MYNIIMKRARSTVKEITISEFKAKCLSLLDEVNKTRRPIRITRHGKPIAEVGPPSPDRKGRRFVGAMAGTIEILGDIMEPVIDLNDFEAYRD
jgi:prevent-host-death family protein